MGAIARLAFHVQAQPLGRQVRENTLMRQFQYVDRFLIENLGHMEQRARPVLQDDTQPRQTARPGQVAQQNIGQQSGIDIAAGQDQSDIAADKLVSSSRRSSTSSTSSANRSTKRRVNSPGCLTAMPSASVSPSQARSAPLMKSYMEG